jgi:hypothetical protein
MSRLSLVGPHGRASAQATGAVAARSGGEGPGRAAGTGGYARAGPSWQPVRGARPTRSLRGPVGGGFSWPRRIPPPAGGVGRHPARQSRSVPRRGRADPVRPGLTAGCGVGRWVGEEGPVSELPKEMCVTRRGSAVEVGPLDARRSKNPRTEEEVERQATCPVRNVPRVRSGHLWRRPRGGSCTARKYSYASCLCLPLPIATNALTCSDPSGNRAARSSHRTLSAAVPCLRCGREAVSRGRRHDPKGDRELWPW